MFNAARLYSAIWPIILLNLVFYVLFWSYSKSRKQKMERKQAKQENQWIILKWKSCLDTSYINHNRSHVCPYDLLVSVWAMIMPLQRVPGLVLLHPPPGLLIKGEGGTTITLRVESVPTDPISRECFVFDDIISAYWHLFFTHEKLFPPLINQAALHTVVVASLLRVFLSV